MFDPMFDPTFDPMCEHRGSRKAAAARPPLHRSGAEMLVMLASLVWLASPSRTLAAENRFWLADQYDWGARSGFYLCLENTSPGNEPAALSGLRLILGAGNGAGWKFVRAQPRWVPGKEYAARAVIGPGKASLWIDGVLIGAADSGFAPHPGPLLAGHTAGWASGPADYLIIQHDLAASSSAGQHTRLALSGALRLPLILFQPGQPASVPWRLRAGETVSLTTHFTIWQKPDLKTLSPFIDAFGQCRYASWSGKVTGNADLAQAAREEARRLGTWKPAPGYDRYGGILGAGWHEKPSGFYRVARHDGKWWLVTPAGNPCFYRGICTCPSLTWDRTPVSGREFLFDWLPPHTGQYAEAWGHNDWGDGGGDSVAFLTTNLVRKYGADWKQKETAVTRRRIAAWGFTGYGKWCGIDGEPVLPVLGYRGIPRLVRRPDFFDPEIGRQFRATLERQIAPHRSDPNIVGWSVGNEYDEIITLDEIRQILGRADASASKRALVEYGLRTVGGGSLVRLGALWKVPALSLEELASHPITVPDADLERLRQYYEDRYDAFVEKAVKDADPSHLYLGFWIVPGWWQNETDWSIAARHCDVIGYDRYAPVFADALMKRLLKQADKPVLCGEFSFPPWYRGQRGFGIYDASWTPDEAASGEAYSAWVHAAAANPYCVGVSWFQYRDEPITGRGPGQGPALVEGEHYAFGLIDVTDTPKYTLLARIRDANMAATRIRLETPR